MRVICFNLHNHYQTAQICPTVTYTQITLPTQSPLSISVSMAIQGKTWKEFFKQESKCAGFLLCLCSLEFLLRIALEPCCNVKLHCQERELEILIL